MTASVSQVLSEAADLLAKPGAWTQGRYARSADNTGTCPSGPEAKCFCIRGAIRRIAGESDFGSVQKEAASLLGFLGPANLARWNDAPERTQPEVVDALRRAAALAKEQGR